MSYENNTVEFEVWGKDALFTDPLSRGGEKLSYSIPTYQALIGICSSIYWKPTIRYVIDKLRVMNEIQITSKAVRPLDKRLALNHNTLAYYSYLHNVRYQVQAHIEWNLQREDLVSDRNYKKHLAIFKRALKAGGRRDIFLGTRECQAYVKPTNFSEGIGYYDENAAFPFGLMFHGYNYPNETGRDVLEARFTRPVMRKGIIEFERPEDCQIVRPIRKVIDTGGHDLTQFESVNDLQARLEGGE